MTTSTAIFVSILIAATGWFVLELQQWIAQERRAVIRSNPDP